MCIRESWKLPVYLSCNRLIDSSKLNSPVTVPLRSTQEQVASFTGSCQQTVSETLEKNSSRTG